MSDIISNISNYPTSNDVGSNDEQLKGLLKNLDKTHFTDTVIIEEENEDLEEDLEPEYNGNEIVKALSKNIISNSTIDLDITKNSNKLEIMEEEIKRLQNELSKKSSGKKKIYDIFFKKDDNEFNKKVTIINHGRLNNVNIELTDLEDISEDEINEVYSRILSLNSVVKKRIIVMNGLVLIFNFIDYMANKFNIKSLIGISEQISIPILEEAIGNDCEHIVKQFDLSVIGPYINILFFCLKLFFRT